MVLKTTRLTLYSRIFACLKERGLTLTSAESLTAGLAIADFVSLPGASAVVKEAYVTYCDQAKTKLLGVDADLLAAEGAVCEEVALRMARGVCQKTGADISVALTGVAGPGSGTTPKGTVLKPGTVWIACSIQGETAAKRLSLHGSRDRIRQEAAWEAWRFLAERLQI